MRGVERCRREDGVQKTVGVELQIENERRRARREMAARKGSWERADVPAPKGHRAEDGCCFQIETSSAPASAFPPLFFTPFLPSFPPFLPSFPPSLLCPFLSFPFLFGLAYALHTDDGPHALHAPPLPLPARLRWPWGEDGYLGGGKFGIRLVPLPAAEPLVVQYLESEFAKLASKSRMEIEMLHSGKRWVTDWKHWNYTAAIKATEAIYSKTPDLKREGSSIPVTLTFAEMLNVNVVLLPMGRGDDGADSTNEKLDKSNFIEGTKLLGTYLYELADIKADAK
ncbi:hypothetical protein B0H13DRAFT_1024141 [Mycena leptocephala]|nr:hypothetical protein B0H13DRAFT_1024141 [Mycena leptocephala]